MSGILFSAHRFNVLVMAVDRESLFKSWEPSCCGRRMGFLEPRKTEC